MNSKTSHFPLKTRALLFAAAAHEAIGKTCAFTGKDHIHHPIDVSHILQGVKHSPEMVAAALLHDVIKNTQGTGFPVTMYDIHREFGPEVTNLVRDLSILSASDSPDLHSQTSAQAQTIQVANMISSLKSIVVKDVNVARRYLFKKAKLLVSLPKANETLTDIAAKLLHQESQKLGQLAGTP